MGQHRQQHAAYKQRLWFIGILNVREINHYRDEYIVRIIKYILSFINTDVAWAVSILHMEDHGQPILHSWYHSGWYSGDTRNQGISSFVIRLLFRNIPISLREGLTETYIIMMFGY